ncbi:MAG: ATP--guanido phosphotransferase [Elusimicrobia bacterium]|nr:ATP--guanido phosphotransferase [Candidatus Obscuribacterium magneticum]
MAIDFSAWATAPASWIASPGNDLAGTVISSRVRVARNLTGFPFPHNAPVQSQRQILNLILPTLMKLGSLHASTGLRLDELNSLQRSFLMERQLISYQHANQQGEKGLVVSSGERLAIMINEEDHIRAACFSPGLALDEGWTSLNELDDEMKKVLPMAYDPEFGFITACPTNMGTAIRASCLMHLPALASTGRVQQVMRGLERANLVARGFYGEGTSSLGDLFQISNANTLGRSETALLSHVEKTVKTLSALEKDEQEVILKGDNRVRIEDRIFRSLGTLQSARVLNFNEAMYHLSMVRLGILLGVQVKADLTTITNAYFLIQPAHLLVRQKPSGTEVSDDVLRAATLRQKLN